MLIKCPECELQVSDQAYSCPHCGYPLKKDVRTPVKRKSSNKHKRLPNGFGQITKISNKNLRNPYRAMVTTGKDPDGRPICKLLKPQSYFASYNEAYEALVDYNRNPYDLEDDIKVFELYDRWSTEYFKTLKSDSSVRTVTSAWAYCKSVEKMRAKDLRARHIKYVLDEGTANIKGEERHPTASTKSRIKSLFNLMLDYAVEFEIVDKNYARTFDLGQEVINEAEDAKRSHISFTDEEMRLLWENINMPYVRLVLIQCYMGWRPQEIGLIEISNVDLDNNMIIGGMKTDAGIERPVPIHPLIKDFIVEEYKHALEIGSKYLFNCEDPGSHKWSYKMTYDKYSYRFRKVISNLGLNEEHRAHDPRKQFVTMCKKYNVDEYAIKRMAGHKIEDITESVYTDRSKEWLYTEICKIKKY